MEKISENLTIMADVVNAFFAKLNHLVEAVFFTDVFFFTDSVKFPLVVFLLFVCSVYLTFKMGFINLRLFRKALSLAFSRKENASDKGGEISHFKALTTALSATVGLGNIAGVALAISIGGPGATLWMILIGFLAMNTKFTECTLAVMYREKRKNDKLMGGPMEYLFKGLGEMGWPRFGKFLSIFFCILCIGGSFGGGTAFQVNQSLHAIGQSIEFFDGAHAGNYWIYGVIVAFLVGLVVIGGIKRISTVASRIVPFMCLVYILMAIFVLAVFYEQIPLAISTIVQGAFRPEATWGGFVGVMVVGMQRAFFSNEAGLGSAAIAHSVAKVNHPVEEGAVALLEPFIDTILICTVTALVIVVTQVYENPDYAHLVDQKKGAALTSQAFSQAMHWFPYVLSGIVFLFSFSTIISWSYYGERCFSFVFGEKMSIIYKVLLLVIIFLSSIATSKNIMNFGDLMILSMAFPNVIGVILLSGKVKRSLVEYLKILKQ